MNMDWSRLKSFKFLFKVFVIGVISLGVFTKIVQTYQNWDDDPDRGAIVLSESAFGDRYDKIFSGVVKNENGKNVPWQGWGPEDSMWFYTTTQGSNLMPYDFYMALEQNGSTADNIKLFRSNENMDQYRYIPLKPTFSNPDGLSLGFVKDSYKGKNYMGLTCAACHTNQINYNGTAMRVDGGPSMADMETFIKDISAALTDTKNNKEKRERFIAAVLERNTFGRMLKADRDYTSKEEVEADLKKFEARLLNYKTINHTAIDYGYARLDAFGRIFNRTIQHVLNKKALRKAINSVLLKKESREPKMKLVDEVDKVDEILAKVPKGVVKDADYAFVVEKLADFFSNRDFVELKNEIFNSPSAPVSYPFIWDTPQHDYVQWNGILGNSTLLPLGRNTGEVIGVFGTLDWHEEDTLFSVSALLDGKAPWGKHVKYESSVNVTNLELLENRIQKLWSPKWPEEILGELDQKRIKRGEIHFNNLCVSCHGEIDRADKNRKVIANFTDVDKLGTDKAMATNALTYSGYSGITQDQYLDVDVGHLYMEEKMPAAALLTIVTKNVIATPDADKWWIRRTADWAYTLIASLVNNPIKKESLKRGDYTPDNTSNPFASLYAYKGRPLNGIWATAPYLHNGSVPTLYDLLLPKKKEDDPENGEYRPEEFYIGSREFDSEKVGFINEKGRGFEFSTRKHGNSNAGHEYGYKDKEGNIMPLTKEQRLDLLEYMKSL